METDKARLNHDVIGDLAVIKMTLGFLKKEVSQLDLKEDFSDLLDMLIVRVSKLDCRISTLLEMIDEIN